MFYGIFGDDYIYLTGPKLFCISLINKKYYSSSLSDVAMMIYLNVKCQNPSYHGYQMKKRIISVSDTANDLLNLNNSDLIFGT